MKKPTTQQIIKTVNGILIAAAVVLAVFLFQKCESEKRAKHNVAVLQGEVSQYKNKIGTLTTTVGTLQLTNKQLKTSILQKNDSLKKLAAEFSKVSSIVETQTIVLIDSVSVPFPVPVEVPFERSGFHADKWFSFDYNINQNGFSLADFTTWNEQTIITGFKRSWFLGRQHVTTDITNTNPYIDVVNVRSVEVVIPKKWYDTRVFNLSIGFVAGAYLFSR